MTHTVNGLEALSTYRADIDAGLKQFFRDVPGLIDADVSPYGQHALERLESYCLRPAKRLRGSLAALTYDTVAGTSHAPAGIHLGVVLELMQSYLLIVDDVMDRSALRRGEATVHELYKLDGVAPQTADMAAINLGLLVQHLASSFLAKADVPSEALVHTMGVMQRNIALTGFGQLDDLLAELESGASEADVIRKYVQKSSYYTFVNPLQLGFSLAYKDSLENLETCEKFGIDAGIAFQLHDDFLGMFGSSGETGKSTLDDLREGKFTLLIQYALEHADEAGKAKLRQALGNPDAREDDLQMVQGILRSTGAQEYCEAMAVRYGESAKQVLAESEIGTAEFRQLLADVVDYCVTRKQ